MAPISDAVFLRRNNQIQDAIDGQNLKQALQLIEKRMKKGEDTRFLKAWKAHVLWRHADEAHHKRGITETLELCNAEPPTTDIDTLDILFRTLQKLDGHETTRSNLWERAAKVKPQDLEIQGRWFTYAFESNDWKSAQKAAMSLQKNFPRDRKYYFWAIFLSHLIATDERSSETDRKLFGTLAYRMISKAAADVPQKAQESSPPRAIQTSEELRLLIKIYETQGKSSEVVKILDSDNLGLKSRIVQNDNAFLGFKAANLIAAQMWEEGVAFVKGLYGVSDNQERLKALREIDDWSIWNLLVTATKNAKDSGIISDSVKFAETFSRTMPKSRNAALARLDIISHGIQRGEASADSLLSASREYIDNHIHKLYAFNDIRRVIGPNKDHLSTLLDYINKHHAGVEKTNVPAINALKLEYCLNISGSDNPSSELIESFAVRCLEMYDKAFKDGQSKKDPTKEASSTIESQPIDDLCILAAMCLLQPTEESETGSKVSKTSLIRAAAILDRLCRDSPHNYEALLLLVRIYLLLGAGSLALSTFSKLSVKQIQFDSVAHILLTRLSTIHPHSAPPVEGAEYKDFDPLSAYVQGLNFFRTSEVNTMRYRTAGLDEGAYVNTEEIIELRRRLSKSINRRLYALEVRRTQRLAGGDSMGRYDELARDDSPFVDSRKFGAFMSCEFVDKPPFEERIRLGPLPKTNWLASARITDRLFSVLKGISLQRPLTAETELPSLEMLSVSDADDDQTIAEKESCLIHTEMLKVALFMAGSKTITLHQVEGALGEAEKYLKAKKTELTADEKAPSPLLSSTALYIGSETPIGPAWNYLHRSYTLLETAKALWQLVTLAGKRGGKSAKLPKESLERVSALVPEIYDLVRSNARALKQRVSAPGVLSSLIDLVIQGDQSAETQKSAHHVLESTLDSSCIELFCGALMESWEEALDGLLLVRL
ncbi:Cytoskeleton organization protein Dec1 [Penicillium ucsense]|uniref:Cytoskeleton organization protein Dec1 n=1 Tax=Penicillium ucsense TaxID=2839758 RepID=A0A8J8W6L7_9EURO|nr:Cytoskeleton organization protein Dec1 [Penicillium ucsense]KAF7735387.1 Cytoskeleton organization protein Dec1 [Penicillium ucsense]